MNDSNIRKAQRIDATEIAEATAKGVERAVEARRLACAELSPEEIAGVSGGIIAATIIRAGGIPPMPQLTMGVAPATQLV